MTIRTMCFDTESNYYWDFRHGIQDPEVVYDYFITHNKVIRFDCGIVFDSLDQSYHEFGPYQAEDCAQFLLNADLIVSQNGRRCDFVVLALACGSETLKSLLQKDHFDLVEHTSFQSLDNLASKYCPEKARLWDVKRSQRIQESERRMGQNSWTEERLAKAEFDVKRTLEVYTQLISAP